MADFGKLGALATGALLSLDAMTADIVGGIKIDEKFANHPVVRDAREAMEGILDQDSNLPRPTVAGECIVNYNPFVTGQMDKARMDAMRACQGLSLSVSKAENEDKVARNEVTQAEGEELDEGYEVTQAEGEELDEGYEVARAENEDKVARNEVARAENEDKVARNEVTQAEGEELDKTYETVQAALAVLQVASAGR